MIFSKVACFFDSSDSNDPASPPFSSQSPSQVHGRRHADIVQHAVQLQEASHGDDLRGLGPIVCDILPPIVRPEQHR